MFAVQRALENRSPARKSLSPASTNSCLRGKCVWEPEPRSRSLGELRAVRLGSSLTAQPPENRDNTAARRAEAEGRRESLRSERVQQDSKKEKKKAKKVYSPDILS
ncbi:hypothetical protein MHYP_G00196050 [Metynnis hypsauchen]